MNTTTINDYQVLTLLSDYLTTKDRVRLKCTSKEIYSTDALPTKKIIVKFNKFVHSIPKVIDSIKAELFITYSKRCPPFYANIHRWKLYHNKSFFNLDEDWDHSQMTFYIAMTFYEEYICDGTNRWGRKAVNFGATSEILDTYSVQGNHFNDFLRVTKEMSMYTLQSIGI